MTGTASERPHGQPLSILPSFDFSTHVRSLGFGLRIRSRDSVSGFGLGVRSWNSVLKSVPSGELDTAGVRREDFAIFGLPPERERERERERESERKRGREG